MVTDRPSTPGGFLKNRAVRIVPLYWLATLILAVKLHPPAVELAKSLAFIPYIAARGLAPVLVPGWGLAGVGYALRPQGPIGQAYTSPLLVEFLAGAWLCEAWRRQWLKSQRGWVLVLFGVGWFTVVETAGFYHGAQRPLTWGVPALLIVAGFVAMETAGRKIRLTVFEALGDSSYSLYLFHGIVLSVLVSMPKSPLVFLIGVPLSLIVGILAFRFAEAPILRFMSAKPGRLARAG